MGNTSLTNLRPTKASLHSRIFSMSLTGTLILVDVLGGTTKITPLAAACSFTFFYKIFPFNSYSFNIVDKRDRNLLTICLIPFSWEAKVSMEFNSKLHTSHLEILCCIPIFLTFSGKCAQEKDHYIDHINEFNLNEGYSSFTSMSLSTSSCSSWIFCHLVVKFVKPILSNISFSNANGFISS